jgi:hypothetical protein
MKKILLMLLLILLPLTVRADVSVVSHYIDAEIEIAGALNVKELIVVDGTTDMFQRTLNYYSFGTTAWNEGDEVDLDNGTIYNGQSISIVNVGAYEFDDDTVEFGSFNSSITDYFKEFDIENPESSSYTLEDKEDGTASLKMFYPVEGKRIAFYINYVITNVVVKHNDVKEINYTFKSLNINSKETYLRVLIPYQTDSELYKLWVHGNQKGEVQELVSSSGLKAGFIAKFPEIKDSVNFRITLPSEQVGIDMYLNNSNIDALEEIEEIENKKLKSTNQSKTIVKIMKYALIVMGVFYVICSLVFLKLDINVVYIIYLILGLLIMLFNYLFSFNYWYLYLIILFPILVKILKRIKH